MHKATAAMAALVSGWVLAAPAGAQNSDCQTEAASWREWRANADVNVGLAVFGTNSEANSLSTEEKIELLDRLIAAGVDLVVEAAKELAASSGRRHYKIFEDRNLRERFTQREKLAGRGKAERDAAGQPLKVENAA